MMKKLSLNAKFLLIIGGLAVSCFLIAGIGLSGMTSIEEQLGYLTANVLMKKDQLSDVRDKMRATAIFERDYFNEDSADERKKIAGQMDDHRKAMDAAVESASAAASAEEKEKIDEFKKSIGDWWTNHLAVREATEQGKKDEARALANTKGRPLRQEAAKAADAMVDMMKATVAHEARQARARYETGRVWLFVGTMVAIFASLGFAMITLQQVRRSISKVVTVLDASSGEVQTTSLQIASSADKLSQAATEQGASLQETSASTEELTSMVQRNLEHAKRAENVAGVCFSSAEKGQRVVTDMNKAISEIDASNQSIMSQVESSNQQIGEIVKVIREIGEKTKVINDIVFQTKLLSFNASVEAARAGEHGRGFAVVAEEVGNLAKMSGNAAKEISDMLEGSISKVEDIVTETRTKVEHLVRQGKAKVDTGTRIAGECGQVLDEIVRKVSEVAQMSSNIAAASQEQALGVGEINRTIGQLDGVTHTNSAAAEQASSAAKHLSVQAHELKDAVGSLIALVNGGEQDEASEQHQAATMTAPVRKTKRDNVVEIAEKKAAKASAPAKKRGEGGEGGGGPVSGASGSGSGTPSSGGAPKASAAPAKAGTPASQPAAKTAGEEGAKPPLKLAAGSEVTIPSEDDPRFKDV